MMLVGWPYDSFDCLLFLCFFFFLVLFSSSLFFSFSSCSFLCFSPSFFSVLIVSSFLILFLLDSSCFFLLVFLFFLFFFVITVCSWFLCFLYLCYSFFNDFLKDFQGVSLTFKYYSSSLALIAMALFCHFCQGGGTHFLVTAQTLMHTRCKHFLICH